METVKNLIVGSKNPVKIAAVHSAYCSTFPNHSFEIIGISVPSGVADQPMSDAETLTGALNRAKAAQAQRPEANLYFGVEGGIEEMNGQLAVFAWIVALSKNNCGQARTATFFLPPKVAQLVREGKELGEADDIVFATTNSKQNNGAVGLLSGDIITRTTLYQPAVAMALFPFRNVDLYPQCISTK